MPYLKLDTNVDISKELTSRLLNDLSKLVATETAKPERYVMVEINGGKAMCFGGSTEPLAFLACKSIGLSKAQAGALAASVPKLLAECLPLTPDRIYIEFSNCPAEFWGWNGSTFG